MKRSTDLIVTALLRPDVLGALTMLEWDLLIRQGRRANLLARLAHVLAQQGLLDSVPAAPRAHLHSSLLVAQRQLVSVCHEVECIADEIGDAGVVPILLKGAAYVVAGLPVSHGRLFSDIDILVPKATIGFVEAELMVHGWQSSNPDPYDQRYYRQWMHELPPMQHLRRGTSIDVHHAILPETARVKVNTPAFFTTATSSPSFPQVKVLQPVDMFLHSAAHLFHEGEFEHGLRDLFDLHELAQDFARDPSFWPALVPRATQLGLLRPLFYALRYSQALLGTPVPREIIASSMAGAPSGMACWLMDACYQRVLRPMHASCTTPASWFARLALYVRSHWIRMPTHLLVRHLLHKAVTRWQKPEVAAQAADPGMPDPLQR